MNEFNQEIGENYKEWRKRILEGIASHDIKLSWMDACKLLGMPLDTNKARNEGEAYLELDQEKEKIKDRVKEEESKLSEWDALDKKREEMEREKIRKNDQMREYRKARRDVARADHLIDTIARAVRDTAGTIQLRDPEEDVSVLDSKENEGVLLLSDWHKGQTSDNHWNRFNDVVFDNRIQAILDQTIAYGKENQIGKLHVFVLGDLINGLIHVTTRINNQENVIKQTTMAAETLISMLDKLSGYFDVQVYFARGNHDRVSANKKEEVFGESFFDLLKYIVEVRIPKEHPSIHIIENEVDDEIIRAEIAGHVCFGVHGHKDKPTKVAEKLTTFMREIPDYIFMGHFHSAAEMEYNGTEIIVNSSLCGTDDYAVSLRRYSHPSQKFLVINERGRVCTYNLMLEEH